LAHKGKVPIKEDLAMWILFALKQALSSFNITKGFLCTGIYLLNAATMDSKMSPSEAYSSQPADADNVETTTNSTEAHDQFGLQAWEIQEIFDEIPQELPQCQQYYVQVEGDETHVPNAAGSQNEAVVGQHMEGSTTSEEPHCAPFTKLLQLPRIAVPATRKCRMDPRIDYHRSLLLTDEEHFKQLEELAEKREEAALEK